MKFPAVSGIFFGGGVAVALCDLFNLSLATREDFSLALVIVAWIIACVATYLDLNGTRS